MLTFREFLKKHNYDEVLMHSNDYPWDWDRGYRIREDFEKRYRKYMADLLIGRKKMKEITTEKSFTESVTLRKAKTYLEETLKDASRMNIHITWGFDEAQSDSFHRGWTGEKFLQCIEKVLEGEGEEPDTSVPLLEPQYLNEGG